MNFFVYFCGMKFILDIKNRTDWDLLRPLLERLGVAYKRVLTEEEKRQDEKDWETIMKGAHDDNFEEFYAQWKEERKDREFPFRDEEYKKDWEIIRKGIDVDDPEQFMKDFEESREDRELPHHLL